MTYIPKPKPGPDPINNHMFERARAAAIAVLTEIDQDGRDDLTIEDEAEAITIKVMRELGYNTHKGKTAREWAEEVGRKQSQINVLNIKAIKLWERVDAAENRADT